MIGDNIAYRLRRFAVECVRVCRSFPSDPAAKHIARQLVRAATGGGANYEEARGAESRADFIHKTGIANKEVREALYWLRLAHEADLLTDGKTDDLINEADELVAILTASIRTARSRAAHCGETAGRYSTESRTAERRTRNGEPCVPESTFPCGETHWKHFSRYRSSS